MSRNARVRHAGVDVRSIRRAVAILALIVSALVVAALAVSAGAKSKSERSVITKVSPMRAMPGITLTIRGKNFSRSRKRNTVIFKGASGRVAFAKPRRASHRKLVVVVPAPTERLISRAGGVPKPTRMRLRVVVKRRNGKLSLRRNSPLVLPKAPLVISKGCLSEYPEVCVRDDGSDYDCEDIDATNFSVPGEDPMRFDGDRDKVGCETD